MKSALAPPILTPWNRADSDPPLHALRGKRTTPEKSKLKPFSHGFYNRIADVETCLPYPFYRFLIFNPPKFGGFPDDTDYSGFRQTKRFRNTPAPLLIKNQFRGFPVDPSQRDGGCFAST